MTRSHGGAEPDSRARAWGTLVRPVISTLGLTIVYFAAPLDRPPAEVGWWWLAVALLSVVGLCAWQTWAILRSPFPRLRALGALAVSFPLFILVFATAYFVLGSEHGAFTEPLTRVDSLYFTVTVFATVGFGDIAPTSTPARIVATVQMLGGLVMIGAAARLFLGAAHTGMRRRRPERPD